MARTNIPVGSPLAKKLYSVAAFAETQRRPSFRRRLTGPAPKQAGAESKLKGQTSPDYPIVQIRDLSTSAGDQVSVDLFNIITGRPTMGDRKLAGRMMDLTFSSMDLRIDQYRAGVDTGGRMTQKRTVHQLRGIAKANLAGYGARLEDQLAHVHLAGARGDDDGIDWAVPKESHEEFADIVVNDVAPPSYGRYFCAGSADNVSQIGSTNIITLETIDMLRATLDDDVFPLQPIRLQDASGNMDPQADDNPLYLLTISSRQWYQFLQSTSGNDWRTFIANAHARSQGWNHPLFLGETGMWNGILVKKHNRAVRFYQGTPVKSHNSSGTVVQNEAAAPVDRALLLGAQALAEAYGNHGTSGYHANWHEEKVDHDNGMEVSMAFMGGKAKVRFKRQDTGLMTDHGVIAVDSYAPDPNA
ncbi:N4-gp56 family major capsid protein [Halorhodospira sp. 9621]|uniref:N4-gp56 family major capsid protein n=1 Tax=unclassified Halorhodospira TaxID=2626748 RepID=UPI001EE8B4A7|nr:MULTISPECIES: N4-gp56 family major capsid protein [unclassified Halorhodospira]MCG5533110.1 N4-gp56 family major capsid protein [Halorhodospira sp. 9621]MCG5537865.1 N4-gp56 family major capsid protein [Halorhodospira sp. 9622]